VPRKTIGERDWEYSLRPVDEAVAVHIDLPARVVKREDGVVENEHGTPLFQMFCIAKPATRAQIEQLQTQGRMTPGVRVGERGKGGEPDHLTTRPPLGAPGHRLALIYTNHRGETRRREVIPVAIYWGESKHHPHRQWLMECWDIEKRAERTYALKDCDFAGAR
jgi:hypothetical protein